MKIQAMTQQEIKQALKLFNKALKEPNITKMTYEQANPIQNYIYTSIGVYVGVFFPNSIINRDTRHLDFIALVKDTTYYDLRQYCILQEWKQEYINKWHIEDDKIAFTTPLLDILYPHNESDIIIKITNDINDYRQKLEVLNNIKYQYKKDGTPYQDLRKCFIENPNPNMKISCYYSSYGHLVVGLKKQNYYCDVTIYKHDTFEILQTEIEQMKQQHIERISQLENELKNIDETIQLLRKFETKLHSLSYTTRQAIKDYCQHIY